MIPTMPSREALMVEFKSDRKYLSDKDLVEAVICLANANGGELWLGVEDGGAPTGLHTERLQVTGLAGLVAARTSPSLSVTVIRVALGGVNVACIAFPKAYGEVATTGGVYLRRRLKADGQPECVAMLRHDRASLATTFGLVDVSPQPVASGKLNDLDPHERMESTELLRWKRGPRRSLSIRS